MTTYFLEIDYLAVTLLDAKEDFFREYFITFSELKRFEYFIQQEFNSNGLNAVVTSNNLDSLSFNIMGDVIKKSYACSIDVDRVQSSVLSVLRDKQLLVKFFKTLEAEKLKVLENIQVDIPKTYKMEK